MRAQGHRESVTLFLRTMIRQYYRGTDRHQPALTVERDGEPPISGLFMTIITNRSPWTYFRDRPLLPVPNPDFNSGLDLLALQRLRLTTVFNAVGQMLYVRSRPPRGPGLLSVLGSESLTLRSARPILLRSSWVQAVISAPSRSILEEPLRDPDGRYGPGPASVEGNVSEHLGSL